MNSYLNDIGTVLLAGFDFQNQPKEPSPWLAQQQNRPRGLFLVLQICQKIGGAYTKAAAYYIAYSYRNEVGY